MVKAAKESSYHEYGSVTYMQINKGHIDVEKGASVELVYANPGTYDDSGNFTADTANVAVSVTNNGDIDHAHVVGTGSVGQANANTVNGVSSGVTFDYNENDAQNDVNDIFHHVDDGVTGTGEVTGSDYDVENAASEAVEEARNEETSKQGESEETPVDYIVRIGNKGYESLKDAIDDATSAENQTIILLKDTALTADDCFNDCTGKNGFTLDGSNHKITLPEKGTLFMVSNNLTIKNMEIVLNGLEPTVIREAYGTTAMENVIVSGTSTMDGNNGMFVFWGRGNVNLTNCISRVNATEKNSGSTGYDAVFIGYSYGYTYSFKRCVNEGNFVAGKAAMFIGNNSGGAAKINVTDCANKGQITSTYVGTDVNMNYYLAVPGNNSNFTLNNESTSYSTVSNVIDDTLVSNTGKVINGPIDTGMTLSKNADGTFTITAATDNKVNGINVAYYKVGIGLYVTWGTGSDRFYVTETINANTGTTSYVTALKDLDFVDNTFVSGGETGLLAGNTTFTKDGTTYYVVTKEDCNTQGKVLDATIYYVSAYDANGNLLATANLTD